MITPAVYGPSVKAFLFKLFLKLLCGKLDECDNWKNVQNLVERKQNSYEFSLHHINEIKVSSDFIINAEVKSSRIWRAKFREQLKSSNQTTINEQRELFVVLRNISFKDEKARRKND